MEAGEKCYLSLLDSKNFGKFSQKFPTEIISNFNSKFGSFFSNTGLVSGLKILYRDNDFYDKDIHYIWKYFNDYRIKT